MAKSLRSKRKQKVKAVRREKYRKIEGEKCWDKHLALQAEKNEGNMDTESKDIVPDNNGGERIEDQVMETETKLSRKGLLKLMKRTEAKKRKKKTKRLGGNKSHSKW